MKIGIITVHDSNNYGSFLQAYALQAVCRDMGHEVYFVRTRAKEFVKSTFIPEISLRELFRHPKSTLKNYRNGLLKWKAFLSDQKIFREISSEELDQMDRILLGSDEIWNVKVRSFQNPVFYGKGRTNVIAYAVSVGKADYDDLQSYPEFIRDIRKIPRIMVRDTRTQSVVEKICGFRPDIVCDPAFLIDGTLFRQKEIRKRRILDKYLLVYSYYISSRFQEKIQEFARSNHLKVVSVCFYYAWADYNIMCGPMEFCSVIENAEYVITTTFHGTIFSILNEKQFVTLPASIKTNDLLVRLNLKERIIDNDTDKEEIRELLQERAIDYERINKEILNMRHKSLALLIDSIESTVNCHGKTL